MKLIVSQSAEEDIFAAVEYLTNEHPDLGLGLRKEIDQHIAWIVRNPKVTRLRKNKYRRVDLKIFPYYIAYVTSDTHVTIIAVSHNRRRPEHWLSRLN